jgi:hypothetical protein
VELMLLRIGFGLPMRTWRDASTAADERRDIYGLDLYLSTIGMSAALTY